MLAPRVPPVTTMFAVTPLFVFMETDSPESVLKLEVLVPEASSTLAVLPEPPLSVISITAEPSGLILLVTCELIPVDSSVVVG